MLFIHTMNIHIVVPFLSSLKKVFVPICKSVVFAFVLSSCVKNTYFNTRAIAPVFTDSSRIHAEAYIGQGIRQIGGNLSLAPIRQGFVTGAYNRGAGYAWEAGLGCIPFKRNNLLVTVLSTYGKGHVDYSYTNDIPTSYFAETKNIDARYQRLSTTLYTSLKVDDKFIISIGARYNFVQYLKYAEHREFTRSPPINKDTPYKGRDSLYFDSQKNFHTLDPFINFHFNFNKFIGLSIQTLYSFRNRGFTMEGQGYKDLQTYYQTPTVSREHYTYKSTLPGYKRMVFNLAVVAHF